MNTIRYQQIRILSTQIAAGLLVVLLAVSSSHWELHYSLISGILFLVGCVLVGIASLGRLWCSLYIAGHKTTSLVVEGPYSVCRNPLYFFSLLGGMGIGFATETITIPIAILVLFALYYPHVIRLEEDKLRSRYGADYESYFQNVPRFWPKWALLHEPEEYTVNPRIFKRHILSALWFIWLVGILEMIEMLHELEVLKDHFYIY